MMQRWFFGLIAIGLIGVIGGSLASRWLMPAPLAVTPTPEPSPVVQPFAPSDQVVDVTNLVELQLPTGWQLVSFDRGTLASGLQTVATTAQPQRREAAQRLAAGLANNASMLAATGPNSASLTLFAFIRNDLLLERYLDEAQSLLQAAGHQVEQASH